MPIGYCKRNRRFSSTNHPGLNNHSNDFKSHLPPSSRQILAPARRLRDTTRTHEALTSYFSALVAFWFWLFTYRR